MGEIHEAVRSLDVHNMDDFKCAFRDLQKKAHDTALEKGWWNPAKTFGEQLVLFHSEISEALEEFRNSRQPNEVYYSHPMVAHPLTMDIVEELGVQKPEGIPIEFADLLIRLMDTCEYYDIDLIGAVLEKMEYNETRSHRHGGKII